MNYSEILIDLKHCVFTPAVAKRAYEAIKELVHLHQLDQAELVRLRRLIERMEDGE